MLFSILVYWFSARERYFLASLAICCASLTRISGILLAVIPVASILLGKARRARTEAVLVSFGCAAGLWFYGAYLWLAKGSPFAFILTQQNYMKRSITWPGLPLVDSLRVALGGYGGFQHNWFVRMGSLQDILAFLLFVACLLPGFKLLKNPGLWLYLAVGLLFLSVSHGPFTLGLYSVSRYVLVLFPGFIVMGMLLERRPGYKWALWGLSWAISMGLTGWFATGRWVA